MGSGKSTVSACLRELGFIVLDADEIVRSVLSPGGPAESDVLAAFGQEPGVRDGLTGHLDRRALGRAVFSKPEKLDQLERLIHPQVRAEVARLKSEMASQGVQTSFYDVPLLFEKQMEKDFESVIVVSAPQATRLSRLVSRTGMTEPEIEERFSRQLPPEIKEARATCVIRNDGDLAGLRLRLLATLDHLKIKLPPATQAKS